MERLDKTSASLVQKKPARRNPEASKQSLIDATLDTIAEIGITDTTVSSIIQRAGLSRGMIHLHFGGKDNLLTSAAKYFNEKYYAEMDQQLARADETPQEKIMAVVSADLGETLLNERSTKIWHAFRGVANSHPGIAKFSSTQDERLQSIVRQSFQQIADAKGTSDPKIVQHATLGTLALLEGMWVHYLSDRDNFSRTDAVAMILRFLNGLFPGQFDPSDI